MYRVSVIQFPGSNREDELAEALNSAGLVAELFRWNRDPRELRNYHGHTLPGGFSSRDYVRAGVIAAKYPIMEVLAEEAERGKPILGICNGCQILAEAGLVPAIYYRDIDIGMAPNVGKRNGQTERTGFNSDWVFISNVAPRGRSAATYLMEEGDTLPIPIAHAEGRFRISTLALQKMHENGQVIFQYCDERGGVSPEYPVNPNGSDDAIAGVCNPAGNVVAMMPHPEAANFLFQIPDRLSFEREAAYGNIRALEMLGPAGIIFESFAEYVRDH